MEGNPILSDKVECYALRRRGNRLPESRLIDLRNLVNGVGEDVDLMRSWWKLLLDEPGVWEVVWITVARVAWQDSPPPPPPSPGEPFIQPAPPDRCRKCGLDMSGAMGYVCGDPACPSFPRITMGGA